MDRFRFVLVGSGNISSTYAAAIANLPDAEIVGVVSRSGGCPDGVGSRICIAPRIDAISVPFDAVILATPNGMHHSGAIEAARLGKHVLTEKPLDISIKAMDAMEAACLDAGVTLAVCYQRRMSPDNQVMKELLAGGALGRVYAADLSVKFYRDQAYYDSGAYRGTYAIDGGGPFVQQACHNIDLYAWFFGVPNRVVSMLSTMAHEMEAEDHGAALLHHENGMIGSIIASTLAKPGFAARLEIHAERGSVVMVDDVITHWSIEGINNPTRMGDYHTHDAASSAAVDDTSGHEGVIRDFIDSIRQGREPASNSTSARIATELILSIYGANILGSS
ncbi:MAG: UDP-N-acetyl-2-amino-2-deoxyglucuronate dehydrogenase [Rhodothermales bacterium]|jgi:UDP-N-acetyl-2-amino-2-deoxyglucuronate dehydrogenase